MVLHMDDVPSLEMQEIPADRRPSTSGSSHRGDNCRLSLVQKLSVKVRGLLSRSASSSPRSSKASSEGSFDSQGDSSQRSSLRAESQVSSAATRRHTRDSCEYSRRSSSDGSADLDKRTGSTASHGPTISSVKRKMASDANDLERYIPALCELLDSTVKAQGALEPDDLAPSSFIMQLLQHNTTLCTPCVVVFGLIYLERLQARHPLMALTPANFVKLLTVAFVVASKYCEDYGGKNSKWASLTGISLSELNNLELDLLFALSFDLSVSAEECGAFMAKALVDSSSDIETPQDPIRCATGAPSVDTS